MSFFPLEPTARGTPILPKSASVSSDGDRALRSIGLRSRYLVESLCRQGGRSAPGCHSYLLLPYAHALRLGPSPRLFFRPVFRTFDYADPKLPADVGRHLER